MDTEVRVTNSIFYHNTHNIAPAQSSSASTANDPYQLTCQRQGRFKRIFSVPDSNTHFLRNKDCGLGLGTRIGMGNWG